MLPSTTLGMAFPISFLSSSDRGNGVGVTLAQLGHIRMNTPCWRRWGRVVESTGFGAGLGSTPC